MSRTDGDESRRLVEARGDNGEGLVAPLVATAIAFLVLASALEFVVGNMGRARLQHALAQAARAGAVFGGAAACQENADESSLLGGSMRKGIRIVCTETSDRVIARASGQFEPWLPTSWPWKIEMVASAARPSR